MIIINKSGTINKRVLRVPRVLRTGGGEACINQCGWMCKAERCGWTRKAERSGGLAGRSGGLAGRSGGLAERSGSAGRSGGLAEQQRWRSFAEWRSFWVFPLHSSLVAFSTPLPFSPTRRFLSTPSLSSTSSSSSPPPCRLLHSGVVFSMSLSYPFTGILPVVVVPSLVFQRSILTSSCLSTGRRWVLHTLVLVGFVSLSFLPSRAWVALVLRWCSPRRHRFPVAGVPCCRPLSPWGFLPCHGASLFAVVLPCELSPMPGSYCSGCRECRRVSCRGGRCAGGRCWVGPKVVSQGTESKRDVLASSFTPPFVIVNLHPPPPRRASTLPPPHHGLLPSFLVVGSR